MYSPNAPRFRRLSSSMLAVTCVCLLALSGCAEPPAVKSFIAALDLGPDSSPENKQVDYKTQVAQRIEEVNAAVITPGRPQAMLRSVVVLTFVVGKRGEVLRASIYRTNGDDVAERVAMTTLKRSAPFPPPPKALLNRAGQVQLMEAWLFNNDGRFQLQTLAAAQKDEGSE
jgi:protein TonB